MRKFLIFYRLFLIGAALFPWPGQARAGAAIPEDGSSAVILAYHRIGEDAYPDTSLKSDQFQSHVEELLNGDYNVLSLPKLLAALKNGEKLPPRSIAITFEGAYQSAFENGMKLLLEKNMPFTVFFASDNADNATGEYLDWEELKALKRAGTVDFGILPASYARLSDQSPAEILSQLNKARLRFRQELGGEAVLFSYPFGEYSLAYKDIIAQQGFAAAFGLHSGTVAPFSDLMTLPRFTMTEIYGDIDRFRMVTHALPLPVEDTEPQDPFLNSASPSVGFSIAESLAPYRKSLSCHVSGQAEPKIEFLGERRVELRLAEPLSDERTRVNCTMPGPSVHGQVSGWRWLGMLLVLKDLENEDPNLQQDGLP